MTVQKERYTSEEISEHLDELVAAGLFDFDDQAHVERMIKEFYFRGLVHGGAEDETIAALREELGY